ncbi:MAG: sigma-54-dependent Fis family transcriptional regulator [Desulfobulbaceae bacterium]|nr:sigma-54-dependent Fis family transcriptional regulator [Desulfobulbaceae bacterium]
MGKVLIIDDSITTCELLQHLIEKIGHCAEYHHTLSDGLMAVQNGEFDVVFLDVMMPDGSGLDHIKDIQNHQSAPEVIIITGAGSTNGAEIAIKSGAWDYLQKPISPKKILLPIKRVLEYKKNLKSSMARPNLLKRDKIIGTSKELENALQQLARAAHNESNVLITGETGTGKEIFAQTLHENCDRSAHPLIIVDCASLPENLIESAMFGHVKGAFTGADRSTDGLVKMADTGTLFLDEIGELNLVLQKTLLRVLQEKTFRPVGSVREQQSDFRLIAATNRNLKTMVREGAFREDLYFRLQSQLIEIPSLRVRKEDIAQLVVHYSKVITEKYNLRSKGFSPEFFETLNAYQWPGNVRELIHVIEQAIFSSQDEPIMFRKHLPEELRIKFIDIQLTGETDTDSQSPPQLLISDTKTLMPYSESRAMVIELFEKNYLEHLMHTSDGKIKRALEIAQLGRTRLYTLLKKHHITR